MNLESQETLLEKNTILDAISAMRQEINQKIDGLRQEMNERFDKVEARLTNVEARLTNVEARLTAVEARLTNVEARLTNVETRLTAVEADVTEIKELQFSFDVRLERIESAAHESLSIGHNLRADVKILRAEVGAWAKDVMRLERQTA